MSLTWHSYGWTFREEDPPMQWVGLGFIYVRFIYFKRLILIRDVGKGSAAGEAKGDALIGGVIDFSPC